MGLDASPFVVHLYVLTLITVMTFSCLIHSCNDDDDDDDDDEYIYIAKVCVFVGVWPYFHP